MGAKTVIAGSFALLVAAFGSSFTLSSGTGPDCGTGTVDTITVQGMPAVAGFGGDQLVNAAAIMNAATAAGLPQQAQTLGVMTAIGESSLRNLAYGDAVNGVTNPDGTPTTSLGLFQQQDGWGSRTARLDPSLSATLFFARLALVPDWQTMAPTEAAHTVQGNADPDHYAPFYEPAAQIVETLTATAGGGGCAVGGNAQALAQELVTHADDGTLTGLVPDHIKEIRWIAQGRQVPDCGINTTILQVIVIAVRNFPSVGISDINRKCTGQIAGAGTASRHYTDGGGHAVDFYRLDGLDLTGFDGQSIRLIGLLDPVMPFGSAVGQSDCRADAGRTLALRNLGQFPDGCTHLHVEVDPTIQPLTLG
jgi:hypothetical protein